MSFTRAEGDLLLVKGVQLVVDQPQLLGMRHLMLLLGIRLTRLLHALAARHRDRFLRFSTDKGKNSVLLSGSAEFQDPSDRIETSSSLSNRDRACARLVSALTIY